ncbi:unnamed protein product [Dovyalis caffra]|uniref:Uncharacterized protein n=1 Tax=Dovyalis caffra TaxID=77055 RepID=A0AAV1RRB9_9ROSI|nr:unnamed protein product [Dovyalis caffra]
MTCVSIDHRLKLKQPLLTRDKTVPPDLLAMGSKFAFAFLLFYFLMSSHSVTSQTSGNVSIGESLAAMDQNLPWLSPSNDFAFGFRQLSDNDDFFLLAMWYYKIPDRDIVWYANGDRKSCTERIKV